MCFTLCHEPVSVTAFDLQFAAVSGAVHRGTCRIMLDAVGRVVSLAELREEGLEQFEYTAHPWWPL